MARTTSYTRGRDASTTVTKKALKERESFLLDNSLAKSTRISYIRALHRYKEFHSLSKLSGPVMPINNDNLAAFIAHLSLVNMSGASINSTVSALAFFHKTAGFKNPTDSFKIKKLLKAVMKINHSTDKRLPFTEDHIKLMVIFLKNLVSPYETKLFSSLFTLMYAGMLRMSEVVPTATSDHAIRFQDVSLNSKLTITLRHFKHSKPNKTEKVHFNKALKPDICPVHHMKEFLKVRPKCKVKQLFVSEIGNKITANKVSNVLKMLVKCQNLNQKRFTSHSMRIGRTTQLSLNMVPENEIVKMGRWRSKKAMCSYIRK